MKILRQPYKFVILAITILAGSLGVLFAATIFGAFGTIERSYRTKHDAQVDRLFGRGWLPEIIPGSSSSIELSSNLDINTSTGSFNFDTEDLDDFVRNIQNTTAQGSRFMGECPRMRALTRSGYMSFYYRKNGTIWRFFIHPENGHCEYWAHGR